jgi:hypothetical protein
LVISPQLNIWPASWPGPADPHISSSHHFKLKIPLPRAHCVRPLYPEKSDLVYADFFHSWISYCEESEEEKVWEGKREPKESLVAFLKGIW